MPLDAVEEFDFDSLLADPSDAVEVKEPVRDTVNHAVRIGFIGAGQAGCNLVDAFYRKCGYRRCIVFNSTGTDTRGLDIPENYHVLAEGFNGAGKDRAVGEAAVDASTTTLSQVMADRFGSDTEYVLICTSGGGGTGSGSAIRLAQLARSYLQSQGMPAAETARRVGFIVMLPHASEGSASLKNAGALVAEINNLGGAPIVYVDNDIVTKAVKKSLTTGFENPNTVVAQWFDLFNTIALRPSPVSAFDSKDYQSVLSAGIQAIGRYNLPNGARNENDLSSAVRKGLEESIFIKGLNLKQGTHVALVVTGDTDSLDAIHPEGLSRAQNALASMLGSGPDKDVVLHTGVYQQVKPGVVVSVLVGGVGFPEEKRKQLLG